MTLHADNRRPENTRENTFYSGGVKIKIRAKIVTSNIVRTRSTEWSTWEQTECEPLSTICRRYVTVTPYCSWLTKTRIVSPVSILGVDYISNLVVPCTRRIRSVTKYLANQRRIYAGMATYFARTRPILKHRLLRPKLIVVRNVQRT